MTAFLITGNPGSGKTTLARELVRRGLPAIDPDDDQELSYWEDATGHRLSAPARPDEAWLRSHRWVWSRSALERVLAHYQDAVFVCGIARNQDDLLDLFERIFLLRIDEQTQEDRLDSYDRANPHHQRSDAGRQEIRDGRAVFEAQMLSLGAIALDGTAGTAAVADQLTGLLPVAGVPADRLLAMAARDRETRDRLANSGELEGGYHPQMRAVHEANADELSRIIAAHGWPDATMVGAEAAEAAWLVVQHAISRPDLMRSVVPLLTEAVDNGRAPAAQLAYLTDRISCSEGRPQRYGTQFDHDDNGLLAPYPLEDPANVDTLRAGVGLEPLAEVARRHRANAGPAMTGEELRRYRAAADEFAREVGWR